MEAARAGFPMDWLADAAAPATDVELALLLVNSHDLLEEQPDRLVDLTWLTRAFTAAGHGDRAAELSKRDLPRLRDLRDSLRRVFESDDVGEIASVLNPLLERARAIPLLVVDSDGPRPTLQVGVGLHGAAALQARLPAALAAYVAEHGTARLGVCHSDPCRCVFVDRTRAGTRKYCCTYCNDRYAARAYRRRKRG
jgi:predicted RNA-binding Zn ribbon-like protein